MVNSFLYVFYHAFIIDQLYHEAQYDSEKRARHEGSYNNYCSKERIVIIGHEEVSQRSAKLTYSGIV